MSTRLNLLIAILVVVRLLPDVVAVAPVFTSPNPDGSSSVSIGESTSAGTSIYSIAFSGTAPAAADIVFNPASTPFEIISGSTIQVKSGSTIDYESGTTSYTLTIEADDNSGNTATVSVIVSITDENDNIPTISTSGLSGTLNEEETAGTGITGLAISASDADASDVLTYSFIAGGAPNFQIHSFFGVVTTLQAIDYDTASSTTFNPIVQVSDSAGQTATATLIINLQALNDNTPTFTNPVTGGSISISIGETTGIGSVVYSVLATDADRGDSVSYSLEAGSSSKFSLSGQDISVAAAQSFDYETASDRTHVINLKATDTGSLTATTSLTITITDENDETPTLTGTFVGTVAENQAANTAITSLSLTAADGDTGDTLTFSFISGGAPEFQISTAGVVTTKQLLDYDTASITVYNPVVKVVDSASPVHSATATLAIFLTAVNDNTPVFSNPASDNSGTISIPETTAGDTVVTSLLATDVDGDTLTYALVTTGSKFTLTGQSLLVRTASLFDYETAADRTHTLTLRATDPGGLSSTVSLTITITDENDETPTLTGTFVGTVAENQAANTAITSLSLTAADGDTGDTLTFSFISGGAPEFQISTAGLVTTKRLLDYDTASITVYNPVVKVVDSASPVHSATATLAIFLTAVNDNTPVFSNPASDNSGTISIPETTAGDTVVTSLLATDVDGDTLTYALVTTGSKFTLTGQSLSVRTASLFDYETAADRTHTLTLRATDPGGLSSTVSLTITITDENDETPTLTGTFVGTVAENQAANTAITSLSLTAADGDTGDTLTFSFISGGAPEFQISTAGLVTTKRLLDYDTASITVYNPVVKVVDSASPVHSATATLAIFLTAVNDNTPVFSNPASDNSGTISIPETTAGDTVVTSLLATDVDGDTLTYALVTTGSKFTLTGQSLSVRTASLFDYETAADRTHTLTLRATDPGGLSSTVSLTITITDENDETPTLTGTFVGTVAENQAANTAITSLSLTAADGDTGDTLTFSFISGGAPEFQISTAGVVTTKQLLDYDTASITVYNPVVKVVDSASPVHSATATLAIFLTAVNDNTPVFSNPASDNSGTISIPETTAGDTVVTSLLATDVDGDTLTYALVTTGSKFTLTGQSLSVRTASLFDYETAADRTHTLTLRATDPGGLSSTVSLTITITDENDETPTLTGTFVGTVAENQAANTAITSLSLTAADGDTGDTLTFSFISGGAPEFQISTAGLVTTKRLLDYDTASITVYNPVVKVVDSASPVHSATATLAIFLTAVDDNTPVFSNPASDNSGTISIPETTAGDTVVTSLLATDVDGDTLTYALVTTGSKFTLTGQSLSVRTASLFDYETAADRTHTLTLRATDPGGLSSTVSLTITITDENDETPTLTGTFVGTVAENQAANTAITSLSLTAADGDTGDTLTFSFISGGAPEFQISTAGVVTTKQLLDYDTASITVYNPVVKVVDSASPVHSATATLAIFLTAVNDNTPVFSNPASDNSGTISIPETTAGDTVVTSLLATDVDGDTLTYALVTTGSKFTLTGQSLSVRTASLFDYETAADRTHTLTLRATDPGGLSSTVSLTITITDENDETPTLTGTFVGTVAENQAANTAITSLSLTAADGDTGDTLTFSFISGGAPEFQISTAGVVTTKQLLDYDTASITVYNPVVKVVDSASPVHSATATLAIFLTAVNDNTPVFSNPASDNSGTISIPETTAGDTVVTSLLATDVDGDTLTYALVTTGSKFTLTGQSLSVRTASLFDYETAADRTHTLTLRATDPGGLSSTVSLTITITDENDETPTLTGTFVGTVAENQAANTAITSLSLTAADGDTGDTLTFSFISGGAPEFQISTAGVVTTKQLLDYDTASITVYNPVVKVVDSASPVHSATATLAIFLTAVNDNTPVFSNPASDNSGTISIPETTAGDTVVTSLLATDVDGDTLIYALVTTGSKFTLTGQSLSVRTASLFDYETATDRTHTLTLRATDPGGLSSTVSLTITITDENDETPTLTGTFVGTVAENQAANTAITSLSLTAADGDTGDTLTFSFISGGAPEFQISTAGVVTTKQLLDYDTASITVYNPVVKVVDSASPVHSATATLAIFLTAVNDNTPVFSNPASDNSGTISIPETTAGDTVVTSLLATDVDGDTLTYALVTTGSKFTLTGQSLSVKTASLFDYETAADRTHTLTLSVRDGSLSSTVSLTIQITDVNDETPTVTGDFDGEVNEESVVGTAITSLTITGSDTDAGDTLTYSFIFGGSEFSISSTTGAVTMATVLDYDTLTTTVYNPVIQIVDTASPQHSVTQTLTISLLPINDNSPIFSNPNPDGSTKVYVGEAVIGGTSLFTLSASDQDGDTLTYTFASQSPTTGTNKFTLNSQSIATTLAASFDYEDSSDRLYYITVKANDGAGTTSTAVLTVQITDEIDETPTITGTLTSSVNEGLATGTLISFTYTVADTDASDTLTYSFDAGVDPNFQIDASTGTIRTAAILDYDTAPGPFNLILKVTDSSGSRSATATLTITVNAVNDNTPMFSPSGYTATIAEGTADDTLVTTVTVSDGDTGDTVTVSIQSGDDGTPKFQVVGGTQIKTTSMATDFETLNSYTLIVIGTDGTNIGTATVKVAISGVNEATPAFAAATSTALLSENSVIGTTITTIVATDTDLSSTSDGQITYSLGTIIASAGISTAGFFHIDPLSGVLTTTSSSFDRDLATGGTATYTIQIYAKDQGGAGLSATHTLTLSLVDYNDNEPSFAQSLYLVTIPESTTASTSLVTLVATDDDTTSTLAYAIKTTSTTFFEMDGTTANQLNLKAQVNLDTGDAASYTLQITVKDGGSPELTGTTQVSVVITPVNDITPSFGTTTPSGTISISEDENIGYSVATVAATDTDYGTDGTITFSIVSGNSESKFQIDPTTGKIVLANTLDLETITSYSLGVRATDGGSTAKTADTTVSITVTGVSEVAPTCTDASVTASVAENTVATTTVATLACTDADTGDTVSYSITSGDTSPATFAVSAAGVITVNTAPDYESQTSFNMVVRVTDGTNPLDVPVAIAITPVNEFTPAFSGIPAVSFSEDTSRGTSIATVAAIDTDSNPHGISEYSIVSVTNSGTDYFVIDPLNGYIQLAKLMDYESLPSGDKTYTIEVLAIDGGLLTGTGSVVVTVTDVNDQAPTCSPTYHVVTVAEDKAINSDIITSFGCTDTDGSGSLTYTLSSTSVFNVDTSGTAKLVLGATALNFEATSDYTLILQVSDGGTPDMTTSIPIDITVTDVNEVGPAFASDQTANVAEDTAVGTSVADCVATGDPDGTDTTFGKLVYSILSGNTDNKFNVDSSSGRVSTAGNLDRETIASYSLVVKAIEEAGTNSATMTLAVTITDINDNSPTCTELTFNQVLAESTAVDTVIHTLTCTDADASTTLTYTISSGSTTYFKLVSNVLKTKATIDYDTPGTSQFQVTIQVSDGTNTMDVVGVVVITDVNEDTPAFTSSGTATVAEDESTGALVFTVTANDDDKDDTVSYSFDSTYPLFTLDQSSGQIHLAGTLDRETTPAHTLSVVATDGTNSVTGQVVVTVSDVNDNTPIFNPMAYSTTISEATAAGAAVTTVTATDADDPLTNSYGTVQYSISAGNTGTYFSINTATGAIVTALQLDYETATSYTLTIQGTDSGAAGGARSATAIVTVLVGNDNEAAPVFSNTPYTATFAEDTAVGTSITQVTATDADVGTDGEVYFSMPANADFQLNVDSGIVYLKVSLDYEDSQTHTFVVTAHDKGTPSNTATSPVTITVTDVNDNTPSCTPSQYTTTLAEDAATSSAVATLTCTDADASTNAALTYIIQSVNGVAGTTPFSVSTGAVTMAATLNYEATTAYVVLVEVKDGGTPSLSTTVAVNVAVTDVNENAPVFSGSPPYSISLSESIAVGTSVTKIQATDADSNTVSYYFLPTSAAFSIDPASGDVSTTTTLNYESITSYSITVFALDDGTSPSAKSTSTTLTVTITDTNDEIPVFSPAVYTVSVSENQAVASTIITVTASDADDTTLVYSIASGNTDTTFKIDVNAGMEGEITIIAGLDYETTTSYDLVVHATDTASNLGSTTVHVTITLYNEHIPAFTPSASSTVSVAESAALGFTIVDVDATDADTGADGTLTFSFVSGTLGKFAIDPSSGLVTVADSLDIETTASYTVVIRATDGGTTPSALTADYTLTVTITDVNDVTPVCTSALYSASIAEDATVSTSIAQLTCTDSDNSSPNNLVNSYTIASGNTGTAFAISGSGEVTSLTTLDRETTPSYTLGITVADAGTNPSSLSTTTSLYISVTDVNDNTPVFGSYPYTVTPSETTGVGTSIGQVAATDSDTGTAGEIVYSIFSGNTDGKFSLDSVYGKVYLANTLNYDVNDAYVLVVYGTDKDGTTPRSSSTTVSINVQDANDHDPLCTASLYTGSVAENAAVSTSALTVSCNDNLDTGTSITYSITTAGVTDFSVHSTSGEVTTLAALDIETTQTYTFTVQASDGSLTTDVTVLITVTNVNDFDPAFSPTGPYTATVSESAAKGFTVFDVGATDADIAATTFTFTITGGNTGTAFDIASLTGIIQVQNALDRETLATYTLNLEVSDGGGRTASTSIVITISDENDNYPSCDNTVYTYTLLESVTVDTNVASPTCTDADNSQILLYAITAGNGDGKFEINGNTAVVKTVTAATFDYETTTSYTLTVTVDDQVSLTSTIEVRVFIGPVNDNTPVFTTAPYSASVSEGASLSTAVLTIAATDADSSSSDNTISYSIQSGDAQAQFSINPRTGVIVVAKTLDREATDSYTLGVRASDGTNDVDSTVTITITDVNDNYAVFNPASYTTAVDENVAIGALVLTVTATDDDEGTAGTSGLQYSITGGNTGTAFSITGSKIFTAIDIAHGTNYVLTITGTDQGTPALSSTTLVSVQVNAVNEFSPLFTVADSTLSITEDTPVGTSLLQFTGSDSDVGEYDDIRYYFNSGNTNDAFILDQFTGDLSIFTNLDYDTTPTSYNLNIRVEDTISTVAATRTSTRSLTISLTDVNDETPIFGSNTYNQNVDENVATSTSVLTVAATDADTGTSGTLTYTITSGSGASSFSIGSSDGIIRAIAAIDYETNKLYDLHVKATDGGTPALSTTCLVKISVNDKNDNVPIFQVQDFATSLTENPTAGTTVTQVVATDADSSANGNNVFSYSLVAGANSGVFIVDSSTGYITTIGAVDRETTASYVLNIKAIDSGTDPQTQTSTATVTVNILDENDNDPVFSATYDTSIAEDTAQNTIVHDIDATDSDENENAQLTYTVTLGNTNNDFSIDSSTGLIQVANVLDRETTDIYRLTVTVTDAGTTARSVITTATVTITDVNDNVPVFSLTNYIFSVPENVGTTTSVDSVTATDQDISVNGAVTYVLQSVTTGTASHFTVDAASGAVLTNSALNRETLDTYVFVVRAMDGGTPIKSSSATVTVSITDYNDNTPTFSSSTYTATHVEEQTAGTSILQVTVTDADTGVNDDITLSIDTTQNDGSTAALFILVDSPTSTLSVLQPIDRETYASLSFYLTATDSGTPALSSSSLITITMEDINDNTPEFSPTFYNSEIAYNDHCQVTVAVLTATDADTGVNAALTFSFTQNNFPQYFSMLYTTGTISMVANAETDTGYIIYAAATDSGATTRTTTTGATIRVDTFNPNERVISVNMGISKTSFLAIESTFLSQCTTQYQVTYSTAQCKRWCVIEDTTTSSILHLYVIKDDTADSVTELTNDKQFLTIDEAYTVAALDSSISPSSASALFTGPSWTAYSITSVEKYYVATTTSTPWIETEAGIITVSVVSAVAGVALILGIAYGIYRCRKPKTSGANRAEIGEPIKKDNVAKNRYNNTQKQENAWEKAKDGNDNDPIKKMKEHPPPAVVVLPLPASTPTNKDKAKFPGQPEDKYKDTKLQEKPNKLVNKNTPRAWQGNFSSILKERDFMNNVEGRGQKNVIDMDEKMKSDKLSQVAPAYTAVPSPEPPPRRRDVRAPAKKPEPLKSSKAGTRAEIPSPVPAKSQDTPYIINRTFDGRAIDPVTGRLYEYDTVSNERRWITTLAGEQVKLGATDSSWP